MEVPIRSDNGGQSEIHSLAIKPLFNGIKSFTSKLHYRNIEKCYMIRLIFPLLTAINKFKIFYIYYNLPLQQKPVSHSSFQYSATSCQHNIRSL